jgi:Kdo2-lipid IVA lauroyltransferase/acyltransferase
VIKYRRKVVIHNLKNAFPEKSDEEIYSIAKKFYLNLSDIIFETIKMLTISRRELEKRVVIKNKELITQYGENNVKFIAVQGHYTNWEWVSLISPLLLKHKPIGVYKPLSNIYFDRLFKKMRGRFGMNLVPMKDVLRIVVAHKNELFAIGLIADQTPTQGESVYWTKFLNQDTSVFLGIEKLSKQLNCPVVFFDMQRIRRGYYQLEIVPLIQEPQKYAEYEITQIHLRYLEERIKQKPEDWLWSHRRWKYQPSEEQRKKFNL